MFVGLVHGGERGDIRVRPVEAEMLAEPVSLEVHVVAQVGQARRAADSRLDLAQLAIDLARGRALREPLHRRLHEVAAIIHDRRKGAHRVRERGRFQALGHTDVRALAAGTERNDEQLIADPFPS